jgi:hypothetical protein
MNTITHLSTLDRELSDRLDATLDAETKFELQAMDVLADLKTPEDGRGSASDKAPTNAQQENPASLTMETAAAVEAKEYSGRQETLAKVVFQDGDAFHFVAVPSDGEIGVAYIGSNSRRWLAATSDVVSLLRLYVSVAPPEAPVPWLLAAVDKPKDRFGLVGGRQLCDRVDVAMCARSDTVRLRVPGLQGLPGGGTSDGGDWLPGDTESIGGLCGWNGEEEFRNEVCALQIQNPGPFGLEQVIIKCTPALSFELTHNSKLGGDWKKRKCATARAAACGSAVRIRHQYRKLSFFQWNWVTANDDVVGPAETTGSLWLGLVRRRRRVIYQRVGSVGGFRAWSCFARNLIDVFD